MDGQVYALKRIRFLNRQGVNILMQNENGPCPLLALCNVLLLRNQLQLPNDCVSARCIPAERLVHLFAERLLDANAAYSTDPNAAKAIDDAIKLIPNLNQGLDVNLRFDSVSGFEYTAEFALFDLFDVTLTHGWLVDPEDQQTASVMASLTYNHAVERLIAFKALMSPSQKATSPVEGNFLEQGDQKGTEGGDGAGAASQDQEAGSELEEAQPRAQTAEEGDLGLVEGEQATGEGQGQHSQVEGQQAAERGQEARDQVQGTGEEDSSGSQAGSSPKPDTEGSPPSYAEAVGESAALSRVSSPPPHSSPQARSPIAEPRKEAESTTEEQQQEARDDTANGFIIDTFFRDSASQFTYFGLMKLHERLTERQLCVFFRNNHFSTMFKFEKQLYLLVTDIGYLHEENVVWEKLDEIDGDTEYVNALFHPLAPQADTQIDPDYLMALQMHAEDAAPPHPPSTFMRPEALPAANAQLVTGDESALVHATPAAAVQPVPTPSHQLQDDESYARKLQARLNQDAAASGGGPGLSDEELARRLQNQINSEFEERSPSHTPSENRRGPTSSTAPRSSRRASGPKHSTQADSESSSSGCEIS